VEGRGGEGGSFRGETGVVNESSASVGPGKNGIHDNDIRVCTGGTRYRLDAVESNLPPLPAEPLPSPL